MSALDRAFNIDDLRELARRRLPRGLFEFIDRGAEDEVSLRENRAAFERIALRPRALREPARRNLATQLFGQQLAMPLAVAPTGAVGLAWYDGEVVAARAAAAAGIPYTLSTASITPLERVAQEAGGSLWFQLYAWPQMAHTEEIVRRAQAAGYHVLIVTADAVVPSNREYNKRNAFSVPIRIHARNALDVATHPRWLLGTMLRHLRREGVPEFANLPAEFRSDLRGRGSKSLMPQNIPITREVLLRLRDLWRGPLVVKGILDPADALVAADCGVDGVVVSNHGGRTLDGGLAAIEALPAIADAVGARMPVLFDSGIRRGADIVKALALGASAVLVGRAPLWGTAVAGESGAAHALRLLRQETERVLAQIGVYDVTALDRHCVGPRGIDWSELHKPRSGQPLTLVEGARGGQSS